MPKRDDQRVEREREERDVVDGIEEVLPDERLRDQRGRDPRQLLRRLERADDHPVERRHEEDRADDEDDPRHDGATQEALQTPVRLRGAIVVIAGWMVSSAVAI